MSAGCVTDVQGLTKSFGRFGALNALDLRVEEGHVASGAAWGGLLGISSVTVPFLVVGFVGFRRRDVATT